MPRSSVSSSRAWSFAGALILSASCAAAQAQETPTEPARPADPARPAAAADPADLVAEFGALRDAFWSDWNAWQVVMATYWSDYQPWLAEHRAEFASEDLARAHYVETKGPAPEDPATTYVPRIRALIARAGAADPAPDARRLLLNILGNARRLPEWTETYLEMIAQTPEASAVGINAMSASYVTEQAGRWPEVRAALLGVLEQHPQGASAPGIRYALAEKAHEQGDLVTAKALYQELVEKHPGTSQAEMATAAIYEIEHMQPGMPAPGFEATSLSGETISLAALKGKVVLLDFWATWCGPCLQEMPNVIAVRGEFSRDDLVVVGISLDKDKADLQAFLAEGTLPAATRVLAGSVPHASVDWPQLCDAQGWQSELGKLYRVVSIPRTVLIDREGRIAHLDLRGAELAQAIRDLVRG